jgi:hypothetical protein
MHLRCLCMLQLKAQKYPHILVNAGFNGAVLGIRVLVSSGKLLQHMLTANSSLNSRYLHDVFGAC